MSATEEQKVEKEKSVPKDGQVMISILKDMGINEFEPRVVNQMLEFSYRWAGYSGFLISMNECILAVLWAGGVRELTVRGGDDRQGNGWCTGL